MAKRRKEAEDEANRLAAEEASLKSQADLAKQFAADLAQKQKEEEEAARVKSQADELAKRLAGDLAQKQKDEEEAARSKAQAEELANLVLRLQTVWNAN